MAAGLCYGFCMRRRKPWHKGKWQISRERFQIADETPPLEDPGIQSIGAFIPAVLNGLKLDDHAQDAAIVAAWPELVGPQLAANTRPANLANRVLTIFVSHPGWLMELRGPLSAEILTRLQNKFGAHCIKSIRLAIDHKPRR